MGNFLDKTGLSALWNKIKATFVSNDDSRLENNLKQLNITNYGYHGHTIESLYDLMMSEIRTNSVYLNISGYLTFYGYVEIKNTGNNYSVLIFDPKNSSKYYQQGVLSTEYFDVIVNNNMEPFAMESDLADVIKEVDFEGIEITDHYNDDSTYIGHVASSNPLLDFKDYTGPIVLKNILLDSWFDGQKISLVGTLYHSAVNGTYQFLTSDFIEYGSYRYQVNIYWNDGEDELYFDFYRVTSTEWVNTEINHKIKVIDCRNATSVNNGGASYGASATYSGVDLLGIQPGQIVILRYVDMTDLHLGADSYMDFAGTYYCEIEGGYSYILVPNIFVGDEHEEYIVKIEVLNSNSFKMTVTAKWYADTHIDATEYDDNAHVLYIDLPYNKSIIFGDCVMGEVECYLPSIRYYNLDNDLKVFDLTEGKADMSSTKITVVNNCSGMFSSSGSCFGFNDEGIPTFLNTTDELVLAGGYDDTLDNYYYYHFPAKDGTVALTSDLDSYVPIEKHSDVDQAIFSTIENTGDEINLMSRKGAVANTLNISYANGVTVNGERVAVDNNVVHKNSDDWSINGTKQWDGNQYFQKGVSFSGNASFNNQLIANNDLYANDYIYNQKGLLNGFIDIHPEAATVTIPYYMNELAFLQKKGGSCTMTGFATGTDVESPFNGTPSYSGYTVSNTTDTVTIIVKAHKSFSYGSRAGISFGCANWRAKYVKIELGYSTEIGGPVADDAWVTLGEETNLKQGTYVTTIGYGPETSGSPGYLWNAIRITLTDFNETNVRIAGIFAYNYASTGLNTTLLGVGGGEMYGNIRPYANDTLSLGTPSYAWSEIWGDYGNIRAFRSDMIFPKNGNDTGTLGNVTERWKNVYASYINATTIVENGVALGNKYAPRTEILLGRNSTTGVTNVCSFLTITFDSTWKRSYFTLDVKDAESGRVDGRYLITFAVSDATNKITCNIRQVYMEGKSRMEIFAVQNENVLTFYLKLISSSYVHPRLFMKDYVLTGGTYEFAASTWTEEIPEATFTETNILDERYGLKSEVDLNSSAISTLAGYFTGGVANQANKVSQSITFNNSGSGAASGTTYNGDLARTISYDTIGAVNAESTYNAYYSKVENSSATFKVTAELSAGGSSTVFKIAPSGIATINDEQIATQTWVNDKIAEVQTSGGSSTTYNYLQTSTLGLARSFQWYSGSATYNGTINSSPTTTAPTVNTLTSTSGRYYGIESDSDGRLFVNVPWVNTVPTYYQHTISITAISTGTDCCVVFTVLSKSSASLTVSSLYGLYGSKAFQASGMYGTNVVSKIAFTSSTQARFVYGTGSTTVVTISTLSDTVIQVV